MADNNFNTLLSAMAGNLSPAAAPPNAATGFGGNSGILSELAKHFHADQLKQKTVELINRDRLAQQFEDFSHDPRYGNHPDLQKEAAHHAMTLRFLDPDKKLPKHYQEDPEEGIPAWNALQYRWQQRETRRKGEPPPPPEPAQPAEIPPPPSLGGGGEGSSQGLQMDMSGAQGLDAGPPSASAPPPPPSAPSIPPVPGGVKVGPNAITAGAGIPAPAPTPAPTMPSAAPTSPDIPPMPMLPAGMTHVPAGVAPAPGGDYSLQSILPMTAPEQMAFANQIPAHGALAAALGVPEGSMIDLRALQRGGTVLNKSSQIRTDLAKHGLKPTFDENGAYTGTQPMAPEEMDPATRALVQHRKNMDELGDARKALVANQAALTNAKTRGLTPGTREYDDLQLKTSISERFARAKEMQAQVAISNNELAQKKFEKDTFATIGGVPVPGALYDPKTGVPVGDKTPLGKILQPTVLDKNRASQGRIVIQSGNELIDMINKYGDHLGAWNGNLNRLEHYGGIADPITYQLVAALDSYASLQPALHQARGVKYKDDFLHDIGQLKDNPQGIVASVNYLNGQAGKFVSVVRDAPFVRAGDTSALLKFVGDATKVKNPATGRNYTEREARQYYNRRQAQR